MCYSAQFPLKTYHLPSTLSIKDALLCLFKFRRSFFSCSIVIFKYQPLISRQSILKILSNLFISASAQGRDAASFFPIDAIQVLQKKNKHFFYALAHPGELLFISTLWCLAGEGRLRGSLLKDHHCLGQKKRGQSSPHINNTGAWRKSVWWSAGEVEPPRLSVSGSVRLSHSPRLSGLSSSLAGEE